MAASGHRIQGSVKCFNIKKGIGFVQSLDRRREVFYVRTTDLVSLRDRQPCLFPGEYVSFDVSDSHSGKHRRAKHVKGIEDGPLLFENGSFRFRRHPTTVPIRDPAFLDELNLRPRLIGRVRWFDDINGYGFIRNIHDDNGADIFVHINSLEDVRNYPPTIWTGEYVEFEIGICEKTNKEQARRVTGVAGGPLLCDRAKYSFRTSVDESDV